MKEQRATENYNVKGMERVRSKGRNEEWKMEWNIRGSEGNKRKKRGRENNTLKDN